MTLPIRRLTLYKHGISVVERGGYVTGECATLTFHGDQMNDVLKSLVVFDRAGGQVRNIAYEAPEERETKLARRSVHLSDDATLLDLLRDLRGRKVRVQVRWKTDEQTITGTVVGLDVNDTFKPGRLSLLAEGGIKVLRLQNVEEVALLDGQASADLDFFLRASIAKPEQRTVTLRLSEGEHDLVVRYLAPSPTWRVSYRFVGEKDEDGTRSALLQGWGIFDNPFDEALEGVRISLVSGMPISFVYDLYTPFTPQRPEVKEEVRVAAAPVQMERGRRALPMKGRSLAADESAPLPDWLIGQTSPGMESADLPAWLFLSAEEAEEAEEAPVDMRERLASGTAVAAQGEAQGSLFEYRIMHPVTVPRGEAAMVPILGTQIPYRKEYIYNGQKMSRHPTIVLRFDNSSNLTLERGPISVMEEDSYIGEAIFPFTRPNAEVLLPVAVDLGVSVREERKSSRQTYQITIQHQFLLFHEWTIQQTTYEVSNTNEEPLELIIEHPRQHRFDPFQMQEPAETTEQHYRWKTDVPAGPEGGATFTVRERRLEHRREQFSNLTYDNLRRYLRHKWLEQALANDLQELLKLVAEKQRLQQRLANIEKERQRLMATQEQARKNMSGLKESGAEGTLRARYVRQLNEAEDTLAALEDERSRLKQEAETQEKCIREHIASLG